ncbi:SHOCT domain-containing protein [Antarctobacter jejuensis]|uniref:SHOCT domain-containing protein n=1 Tax=Antarctobacter jejuensis TaxID=1439938 RepID=UPI003FD0C7FB
MSALSDHGLAVQSRLAQAYGLSPDAVQAMMDAVSRGGGAQAQFNVPALGGMGQWQSGGMTMVGDMFNTGLQNTVNNLCSEIANAYFQGAFYQPVQPQSGWQGQAQGNTSMSMSGSFGGWWPSELGSPSSQGAQNNLSYAIFPNARRLAINLNGQVTVYDTGDHLIGGVGQQQSGDASWTFTSQYGTVYLNQLPVTHGQHPWGAPEPSYVQPKPAPEPAYVEPQPVQQAPVQQGGGNSDQIFAALEKLGNLRDMGVLSENEFNAKKAELLSRL